MELNVKQIVEKMNGLTTEMRTMIEESKGTENAEGINKISGRLDDLEAMLERKSAAVDFTTIPGSTVYSDDQIEYKSAFINDYIRKGMEVKAMATDSNADGGFVVPEQMHNTILELARDLSPMREIANVITLSQGNSYKIPVEGDEEFDSGWVGERDSRPNTDNGKLDTVTIDLHEQYAQPAITRWMTTDPAFDMEAYANRKIADRFVRQEGSAFVTGNGVNKPHGFLDSDLVEEITGTLGSTTQFDDLINFQAELRQEFQGNARWVMNRFSLAYLRTIKSQDGMYLWQPPIQAGAPALILGKPYTIMDDMPNIVSSGSLITGATGIAYGDFRTGYMIVDKEGMFMIRDEVTQKPFILLYTVKRTGGAVVHKQAIKKFKLS